MEQVWWQGLNGHQEGMAENSLVFSQKAEPILFLG